MIITTLARPMLAAMFIAGGYGTLVQPERVSPLAEPVVEPIAERMPGVPEDTETAVRLNGAAQVAAGTLLSVGLLPRISALVLAGTLVPTTYAGHRFWEIEDPKERAQQRIHFLKNLAMFGGLLITATERRGSAGSRRTALHRSSGIIPCRNSR